MKKSRLDQLVFERGLTTSRERARTSIMSGLVFVDGQRVDKPGTAVSGDARIELRGEVMPYVSRGGLKLEKALKAFDICPKGLVCIDCGASTGGFTDVLLKNGAVKVYAVDVGYGQLAWSLRTDERVVVMERTNIRHLTPEMLEERPALAVMDLSFISLKLVLPVVKQLLAPEGEIVCLIKPQFEAGKEKVGKKGVVRDPGVHLEVIRSVIDHAESLGLVPLGLDYSPIRGPEGNIEYLAHFSLGGEGRGYADPKSVVEASHNEHGLG